MDDSALSKEALLAELAKYRQIIDHMPGVGYVFSADGIVGFITPSVAAWGYTPDEVIGTQFMRYVHPDDQESVRRDMEEAIRLRAGVPATMRLLKKDGTACEVEEMGWPVIDAQGRFQGMAGVFHDIAARKRMERALQESEENYRALFDSAADLIAVVDTAGNFTALNKKFEEESKWPREEMLAKNVLTSGIVTPASSVKIAYYLALLMAGKDIPIFEVEGVTKDGEKVPYELRAVPIKKGDKTVAIQAILRNLTERKKYEAELRKRLTELEKFNKFAVNREVRMMELKARIRELEEKLGKGGADEKKD